MSEECKEADIVCPICMEHPQNAIVLVCSSHDKGCRPSMCDTNCFQQFCKSFRGKEVDGSKLLVCPLCRGSVWGSVAKNNDSLYSCFNCEFSAGMYQDLGMHVSSMHPLLNDDSRDMMCDVACATWETPFQRSRGYSAVRRQWLEDPQGIGRKWFEAFQARDNGNDR